PAHRRRELFHGYGQVWPRLFFSGRRRHTRSISGSRRWCALRRGRARPPSTSRDQRSYVLHGWAAWGQPEAHHVVDETVVARPIEAQVIAQAAAPELREHRVANLTGR